MTFCDEHEGGCGSSLTSSDYEAGFCTNCTHPLETISNMVLDDPEEEQSSQCIRDRILDSLRALSNYS